MKALQIIFAALFISLFAYSIIGTDGRVAEIRKRAPKEMVSRNWKILRYEGYRYGSWGNHGGKVWYHVANKDNLAIQYRVYVTLWDNELHFTYGAPEMLQRVELNYSAK